MQDLLYGVAGVICGLFAAIFIVSLIILYIRFWIWILRKMWRKNKKENAAHKDKWFGKNLKKYKRNQTKNNGNNVWLRK